MWQARNKTDLIIEVWEKLDCENIGRAEIEAIEEVVADVYGTSAVDSPMVIARLLADEGAQLRHAEIMDLYVERASDRPYDAALRNVIQLDSFETALRTIRALTSLRHKYLAENDKEGARLVTQTAIQTRNELMRSVRANAPTTDVGAEIADWFRIWLETPEIFESWVALRRRSAEFSEKFGDE